MSSPVKANGVGGANFCVVTVPKGKTANIVVYNLDGSSSGGGSGGVKVPSSSSTEKPAPTSTSAAASSSTAAPTSTEASSTSVAKPSTSRGPKFIPGGIFHENSTYTETEASSSYGTTTKPSLGASSTGAAAAPKETILKGEAAAGQTSGAIAGLIVAFVAAAALF